MDLGFSASSNYEPDFVVETDTQKLLCEPKRADQLQDPTVLAKAKAAARWCSHASSHELAHKGKPWRYLLIPHDEIADNRTLQGLAEMFDVADQSEISDPIDHLDAARGANHRLAEQGNDVAESRIGKVDEM